jgi:hypothetical protein
VTTCPRSAFRTSPERSKNCQPISSADADDERDASIRRYRGRRAVLRSTIGLCVGYAGEFGLTAANGKARLAPLLERIQADESLPALARELFAAQAQLQAQIDQVVKAHCVSRTTLRPARTTTDRLP